MAKIIGVFLLFVGCVFGLDSSCDDIDAEVCRAFSAKVDVCQDTCLSKLCPRTCNKCPRKCYSCDKVSSIQDCNTTHICPDMNYECLIHMGINSDFTSFYRLGCASTTVCVSLFGSGTPVGVPTLVGKKKRHNIEGDCCNTDLCNRHEPHHRHNKKRQFNLFIPSVSTPPSTETTMLPTTQTMPPTTIMPTITLNVSSPTTAQDMSSPPTTQTMPTTTIPTQTMPTTTLPTTTLPTTTLPPTTMPTTTQLPVCSDIDTSACQRLATIKKDMCHDSCIMKACPATCGKCSECYTCPFVHSPSQCFTKTMCDPGEKCYVLEEFMDDGTHGYRVGCLTEQVCTRFQSQAHDIFGRRSDHLLLTMDGNCCDGDLCNHKPLMHPTTTTTTTTVPTTKRTTTKTTTAATTHAPTHHHHTVPTTAALKDGCSYITGHHCPLGFDLVNGKCVALTNRAMTYMEAQHYCRSHCSQLMDNISDRDASHLQTYVAYVLFDANNAMQWVRLGAHVNQHGHFVWDSTSTDVHGVDRSHEGDCLILAPEQHHHHLLLQQDPCRAHRYSICQAKKH